MNSFLKRIFARENAEADSEQIALEQCRNLLEIVSKTEVEDSKCPILNSADSGRRALLLIMPLIEVAWANEKICQHEKRAILKIAEAYQLTENRVSFSILENWMRERPSAAFFELVWRKLQTLRQNLSAQDDAALITGLLTQSQFVAQQNAVRFKNLFETQKAYPQEFAVLRKVFQELKKPIFQSRFSAENIFTTDSDLKIEKSVQPVTVLSY